MTLFNFKENDLIAFFLILVRYSVLFSVLPWIGDRAVPQVLKILFSWIVSFIVFPVLLHSGLINSRYTSFLTSSVWSLIQVVTCEVLFSLLLGFTAKLIFDALTMGSHWIGNFMGFAMASSYDSHQETQTGIIAQIQNTLAMLIFLAIDGHHLMLRAVLESYQIVGIGVFSVSKLLERKIIQMISSVFEFGIQVSAPISISLFSVNIIFGLISKSMPQINAFTLSFTVTSLIGFLMIHLSGSEFKEFSTFLFAKMIDWINIVMLSIKEGQ